MGAVVIRTVTDETTDAAAAIDNAIAAMQLWRDHLLRVQGESDDNPALMLQVHRSARIAAAEVARARDHTRKVGQSVDRRLIS